MIEPYMAALRQALRRLAHRRGLAVTVVLVLALGLSATTAILSVAKVMLFEPLPWPDAERLCYVYTVLPERRDDPGFSLTWNTSPMAWATSQHLRESKAFVDVAVWVSSDWTVGEASTELVGMIHASASFLRILGVEPTVGRFFTTSEDHEASDIVVISHELWRRIFSSRREVIGQTLFLGPALPNARRKLYTVVGVLPPGFRLKGEAPSFILPAGLVPIGWRESDQLIFSVFAKLAPSVSLESASAMAGPILRGAEPVDRRTGRLVSFLSDHSGDSARAIGLLFLGASLLLLVSCSNVAGLLLGEAWTRRQEMAVRIALGGSQGRLFRQLMLENVVLASLAALVSLVITGLTMPLFIALAPEQLPRLQDVGLDWVVTALAFTLGGITALVFGIAPGLVLARTAPATVLAGGSRTGSQHRNLSQRVMVAGELGIAFVLVVSAGLLGETMRRLGSQPLGFDPRELVLVSTAPTGSPPLPTSAPFTTASHADKRSALTQRILQGYALHTAGMLERLTSLTGVVAAAGVSTAPFLGRFAGTDVGVDQSQTGLAVRARPLTVTEDYFRVMRVPVLSGRTFTASDFGQRFAVVSREFERRVFDGDAISRRFNSAAAPDAPHTVIGVVGDVRAVELSENSTPTFYALGGLVKHFVIRTTASPEVVLPAVRTIIQNHDPGTIVTSVGTMESRLTRALAGQRFRAVLSQVFGGAALVLAGVGLYGLVNRRLADRRHEFAVRIALGAGSRDIRRLIARDGFRILALGLLLGLPLALVGAGLLRAFLFGVSPTGAAFIFFLSTGILVCAAVSAMIPAMGHAGRISPRLHSDF